VIHGRDSNWSGPWAGRRDAAPLSKIIVVGNGYGQS
jgi:hypothetical protein